MKNVTVDGCLQKMKYYDALINHETAKILARHDTRKREDYEARYSRFDRQNLKKILTYIKQLYGELTDMIEEDV